MLSVVFCVILDNTIYVFASLELKTSSERAHDENVHVICFLKGRIARIICHTSHEPLLHATAHQMGSLVIQVSSFRFRPSAILTFSSESFSTFSRIWKRMRKTRLSTGSLPQVSRLFEEPMGRVLCSAQYMSFPHVLFLCLLLFVHELNLFCDSPRTWLGEISPDDAEVPPQWPPRVRMNRVPSRLRSR
jgi:hypothetical protein